MRMRTVPMVVALLLAGACTDVSRTTQPIAPQTAAQDEGATCVEGTAIMPCPEVPEFGTQWNFFAPWGDAIYEAAGDPSPGAPGIWLGSTVTPSTCFNDRTASITDADHDWLDDHCELELARGFAPRWSMGFQDECPDGEPAWAAKYFPNSGVVRVAFLPAYYDDCGPGDSFLNVGAGHIGDSEFASVDVSFNNATQHWEFRQMWLSAHYGASGDRSQTVLPADAEFTTRYLGYPYIAVSANKHANYKSDSKCNNTVAATNNWGDYCYGSVTSPFRFPIDPSRNVGSRFTALLGCVGSNKKFAGNGRTECFYSQRKPFAGWHVVSDPSLCSTFPDTCGATPYYDILNSDKFEYLGSDGGPGPAAYSPPTDPGDGGGYGGCEDPTQIWCSDR